LRRGKTASARSNVWNGKPAQRHGEHKGNDEEIRKKGMHEHKNEENGALKEGDVG
jgi:hypothetical protein